jgi:vanillate O-demethylase ferredoxin subunit
MRDETAISVRIVAIRDEAVDICSFILRRADGAAFPVVDPGAHVDVRLPTGAVRSFSLSNGLVDRNDYRLTVARDAKGTGGSVFMHDALKVGDMLTITRPHNNFALARNAELSVFIAGGIGITPFIPMLAALNEANRSWKLIYFAKTRDRAALLSEIAHLADTGRGEVICEFTAEPGGRRLSLGGILASLPPDTHAYCCGPSGMIESFRTRAEQLGIAPERVHFEYFRGDSDISTEGGFTVVLQRSGKEVMVRAGQTILDAVQAAGIDVPYSCMEGICGSCETKVISGVPDHRDMVLSERQRQEKASMMICCSGSRSERLVLDL